MNTHARMNRSNVIVCSSTCDPKGDEATVVTELEKAIYLVPYGLDVPNLATRSDTRCGGSFMPN